MIDPAAPLKLPVPESLIADHREALRLQGPHPMKDLLEDSEEPEYLFDVLAIQSAIDAGVLPVRPGKWPTAYARNIWHLDVTDAVVSQGEGSCLDLIWATTMPPERAATPVLVIEKIDGLSLLDGAHRIASAFIEDAVDHPCLIIERADALQFRKLRED